MITIEVTGATEITQHCKSDAEAMKFLKQLKKTYSDGGLKVKIINQKFIQTQQNKIQMNTAQNLINAIAHSKATSTAKTLSSMLYSKGIDISVRGLRSANFNEIHVWNRIEVMERFLSDKDTAIIDTVINDFMNGKTPAPRPTPAPAATAPATTPQVESKIKELLKLVEGTGTDMEQVKNYVDPIFENAQREIEVLKDTIFEQAFEIKNLYGAIEKGLVKETIYITPNVPTGKKIEGLKHHQFEELLKKTVAMREVKLYPWITGGAGGGKTHAAGQMAEVLNVPFYSKSISAQTTETALFGYMNANGNYVTTSFRKCYENGGVFCLDEIDNGNSNILSALNSALANGHASFPDADIKMNEQFYMIATANTTGNGATKAYVGRNQIDKATIDRFGFIEWTYDPELELNLMAKGNKEVYHKVKVLRSQAIEKGLTCVISPRATAGIAALLNIGYGLNEAVNTMITEKLTPQEKSALSL